MKVGLLLIGLALGFVAGLFFTMYFFDQLLTTVGPLFGFEEVSDETAFAEIQQAAPSIGLFRTYYYCAKMPNKTICVRR